MTHTKRLWSPRKRRDTNEEPQNCFRELYRGSSPGPEKLSRMGWMAEPGIFTVGRMAGPELKMRNAFRAEQREWRQETGRWKEVCTLLCLSVSHASEETSYREQRGSRNKP